MSRPEALLLVGHGSSDQRGVDEFTAFTERVRRSLAPRGVDVDGGFIELSPPTVHAAWSRLAARGHRSLAAVPLVLVAAGHAKGDIPAALAREALRDGMSFAMGRPLGPHPALLGVLADRIAVALEALGGRDAAGTAVLLVGRGSTDPDANAEVCKVARLLQEGREYAFVETAFVSLTAPSVPEGLERCRRLGASRVVVAPYFLFEGVLPRRVEAQARGYAGRQPDLEVLPAGRIGDCAELADLVIERYTEALRGDLRMNCDTCAYRVLLPGFGDKLGAPQVPHSHPDHPDSSDDHGDHVHVG